MIREEGFASFYNGLGPSLIGIAPYIAVNFCVFDLWASYFRSQVLFLFRQNKYNTLCLKLHSLLNTRGKKALPVKYQKRTEISLATAMVSATIATVMCYPLDRVRRQMQMKGSPVKTIFDAFPGIVARDGLSGLYRGFLPNANFTKQQHKAYDIRRRRQKSNCSSGERATNIYGGERQETRLKL